MRDAAGGGVVMAEFPPGPGDVHIAQTSKPGASVHPVLGTLMAMGPRDHRTYRAIVKKAPARGCSSQAATATAARTPTSCG